MYSFFKNAQHLVSLGRIGQQLQLEKSFGVGMGCGNSPSVYKGSTLRLYTPPTGGNLGVTARLDARLGGGRDRPREVRTPRGAHDPW